MRAKCNGSKTTCQHEDLKNVRVIVTRGFNFTPYCSLECAIEDCGRHGDNIADLDCTNCLFIKPNEAKALKDYYNSVRKMEDTLAQAELAAGGL